MLKKVYGSYAEKKVAEFLVAQGYRIRNQNYQKPYGEVDIIAQRNETVIFVEVKYRQNPLLAMTTIITPTKQKKIALVAKEYRARYNLDHHIIRFDVALVVQDHATATIEYIENAFQGS